MNLVGSPEWFHEKATAKENIDLKDIIEKRREQFLNRFSSEKLMAMSGEELLWEVFSDNPDSMMRCLMFDKDYWYFGAAGQYKYLGIVYQKAGTSEWIYREGSLSKQIDSVEAANMAKQIRDKLVYCADEIRKIGVFSTINDYQLLHNKLEKVFFYKYPWAIKYYQMLFPHFFPGMYADKTIDRALYILGLPNRRNRLINAGEISLFIRKCDVNNIVFNNIYANEWGWNEDALPCENASVNYKNSSEAVYSINYDYYSLNAKKHITKVEYEKNDLISFPCGGTYNIVRKTLIHAHPVKRGFPSTIPEYLMVRGKGGISHELFKVINTFNFNPYDSAFIESIGDEPFRNRIQEYIYMRDEEFGFGQAPEPYRFYILETVYSFEPPYVLENNTQGYRYLSFSQLGIDEKEIRDLKLDLLEEELDKLEVTADEKLALIKTRINQSVFRERLLKRFNSCCLCDVSNPDFLTASHIKPWADSDNNERLDTDNGFLLCPNHDKLFDRGYISFNDDGSIIISEKLNETDKIFLNVHKDMKVKLTEGNKIYLKYHRDNVFKK